jgi:hypothetical protein
LIIAAIAMIAVLQVYRVTLQDRFSAPWWCARCNDPTRRTVRVGRKSGKSSALKGLTATFRMQIQQLPTT